MIRERVNWPKTDLHIHSNESDDGEHSPETLLELIKEEGISTFSITDHDVLGGTKRMLEFKEQKVMCRSQTYIAGVELSVSTLWCPNCQKIIGGEFDVCPRCSKAELKKLNFHLLGYSFDVNNKPLNEKLNILLEERKIKYNKIVKALGEQKQIELPQVFIDRMIADKAGKNVGSSDIANLLIKLAYVKNIQGAFEHYIKQLKYDDIKLCLLEAIELIRRAGGLTVLAHPIIMMWNYGFTYSEMEAFIIELRKHGVTGLEVFFAENTKTHTDEFKAIARRQGLFMTGGSDFHGYKYHKHLHLGKIGPA